MDGLESEVLDQRRTRYLEVLEPLCQFEEFTADQLRESCREASPAFVTQVLNQLTREGVLLAQQSGKQTRYRWGRDRDSFAYIHWVERQICGKQITQTPIQERPRERLLTVGAENLRTAELLAILIRTGRRGESALDAGERIANRAGDRIDAMRGWAPTDYREISRCVSEAAYCQIMAGIELGRRVMESLHRDRGPPIRIQSSAIAMDYCQRHFARLAADRRHEEFHIVTLDTKLQPIQQHQISVGTLDASLVSPREVFRAAIRDAAAAILLVHNHPSGDPTPSRQDFDVTDSLDAAAKLIGIQIIDHIVVAGQRAASIRELKSRR